MGHRQFECVSAPSTSGEWVLLNIKEKGHLTIDISPGLNGCEFRSYTKSFVDEVHQAAQKLLQQIFDNFEKHTETIDCGAKQISLLQCDSATSQSNPQNTLHAKVNKRDKSDDEEHVDKKQHKRTCYQRYPIISKDDGPAQNSQLFIGNTAHVVQFYSHRFKQLQQIACRTIAKAFVKLMEPKKQTAYPYSGNRAQAPYWWPEVTGQDMVPYKEPDHLLKRERVRLLVHIIQVVVDQTSAKPDNVKAVTIDRLEEVTERAMATSWIDGNPNNIMKKAYLREIFRVAKYEERYRKGELDDEYSVTITLGDPIEFPDDQRKQGIDYNEEEIATLSVTPTIYQCSSPGSIASPHNVLFQVDQLLSDELTPAEPDNRRMLTECHVKQLSLEPLVFQEQNLLSLSANDFASFTPSSDFGNRSSTSTFSNGTVQYANFTAGLPAPLPTQYLSESQAPLPLPVHSQPHMHRNISFRNRPYDSVPALRPNTVDRHSHILHHGHTFQNPFSGREVRPF